MQGSLCRVTGCTAYPQYCQMFTIYVTPAWHPFPSLRLILEKEWQSNAQVLFLSRPQVPLPSLWSPCSSMW